MMLCHRKLLECKIVMMAMRKKSLLWHWMQWGIDIWKSKTLVTSSKWQFFLSAIPFFEEYPHVSSWCILFTKFKKLVNILAIIWTWMFNSFAKFCLNHIIKLNKQLENLWDIRSRGRIPNIKMDKCKKLITFIRIGWKCCTMVFCKLTDLKIMTKT